jgi:GrpB-like predicted nucleotidyltransferase (UPF0157 family)
MKATIEILPSRPEWAEEFQLLKRTLLRVAPQGAVIHHIGSTAVEGLAAKDVIDLQLTVAALDDLDIPAIERAGFRLIPGLRDHCPPGLDLQDVDLRKRFFRSLGRPANLHVREQGRFNQRFAVLCRDYLRANAVAAGAYAQIKVRLAARFPADVTAYYEIKDPVFDILMEGANEWAKRVEWVAPPGD